MPNINPILAEMAFPDKGTVLIGDTGIGKTYTLHRWEKDIRELYNKNAVTALIERWESGDHSGIPPEHAAGYDFSDRLNIYWFLETELCHVFRKDSDDIYSIIRKCKNADYIFLDDFFMLENWQNKNGHYASVQLQNYFFFMDTICKKFLETGKPIVYCSTNNLVSDPRLGFSPALIRRAKDILPNRINLLPNGGRK